MAIKINLSHKDQDVLNRTLETLGYRPQRRRFHCTVGFIEEMLLLEEVTSFGQSLIHELQIRVDFEPLLYKVDKAVHLFCRVLALLPTIRSQQNLKQINLWFFHKVQEMSEGRWELNGETIPENYIPHLTLWRTHKPDQRFKKLEEFTENHPSYHLTETDYVIF